MSVVAILRQTAMQPRIFTKPAIPLSKVTTLPRAGAGAIAMRFFWISGKIQRHRMGPSRGIISSSRRPWVRVLCAEANPAGRWKRQCTIWIVPKASKSSPDLHKAKYTVKRDAAISFKFSDPRNRNGWGTICSGWRQRASRRHTARLRRHGRRVGAYGRRACGRPYPHSILLGMSEKNNQIHAPERLKSSPSRPVLAVAGQTRTPEGHCPPPGANTSLCSGRLGELGELFGRLASGK